MSSKAGQQSTFAQRTLGTSVRCVGTGLHSGERVVAYLHPADVDTGIRFRRSDVKGFDAEVPARYDAVSATTLGTTLSNAEGTMVSTVEHLMAAFWGCGVDNALVELSAAEVPIMDGSSEPFVFLIECAGVEQQAAPRRQLLATKRVEVQEENKYMAIEPAEKFSVSLEIDFESDAIAKQSAVFNSTDFSFKNDLCRARTFGFEHEVTKLREMGLARGGSLENAVVVSGDRVLNKGGLRFANEFARHKILDCIGDFYLSGSRMLGHFSGYRSGHALNNRLLRAWLSDRDAWAMV